MKPALVVPLLVLGLLVGGTVLIVVSYTNATGQDYSDATGEELYRTLCVSCHGEDGTAPLGLANSFAGKRGYWDASSMLEYLADPAGYTRTDPRMKGGRVMPPIPRRVPEAARRRLVRYVLADLMD